MEQEKKDYYFKIMGKVLILLFIALGIFVAYQLTMFYVPFLIAFIIALMVEPVIKFFMKKTKLKRKAASVISLILVVLIIGTIVSLLAIKLVSESTNLVSNLNVYFKDAYDWVVNFVQDLQEGRIQIPEETLNFIQTSLSGIIDAVKNIVYNILMGLITAVSSVPTMITNVVITLLAIVFMCFDKEYMIEMVRKHVPKKWISAVKMVTHETWSVSWNYIKAEAKLSLLCFCLVFVGLLVFDLIGLKVGYTVLMAITIGFIDLLPLFGAGAVMVPWAGYLLITGNIPLAMAIIGLWIVWAVIKQLLEPKVVSKQMGLHPIFTLVGMYTGFKLFGVLGLMIGPIIFLVVKNVFSELIEKGILKSFFELE